MLHLRLLNSILVQLLEEFLGGEQIDLGIGGLCLDYLLAHESFHEFVEVKSILFKLALLR